MQFKRSAIMYLPSSHHILPTPHSCIEQSWGFSGPEFVLKTGQSHYFHCHSDKNSSEPKAIRACAAFNLQLLKKLNPEEAHQLTPVMQHHYFLLTTTPNQWRNNEHWQLVSAYEKALEISQRSLPPPPEPPTEIPCAMPLEKKRKDPEDPLYQQLFELWLLKTAEQQLAPSSSSSSGEPTPKKRKEVFTLKKSAVKKTPGGYLVEERFIGGSKKKKIVEKEGDYYRATHGHSGTSNYIKNFTLDKLQRSRTLIEECIAHIKNDTTIPKEVKDFLLKKDSKRLKLIEELIGKKGTSEKNAVENDKSSLNYIMN